MNVGRAKISSTAPLFGQILRGHYRYYGVPRNYAMLDSFRDGVRRLWHRALSRQQRGGPPLPQTPHPLRRRAHDPIMTGRLNRSRYTPSQPSANYGKHAHATCDHCKLSQRYVHVASLGIVRAVTRHPPPAAGRETRGEALL